MSEPREETVRRDRRVELIAAIMLSIATVVTAWSAYQATRWSGDQSENYTKASATRTESVRSSTLANRQILIDVDTFLSWLDAEQSGDHGLADDIHARMRGEFLPAFDAWLETAPAGSIPDGTPFELSEYRLAAEEKAKLLETQASKLFEDGNEVEPGERRLRPGRGAVRLRPVLLGPGGHVRLAPRRSHPVGPGRGSCSSSARSSC